MGAGLKVDIPCLSGIIPVLKGLITEVIGRKSAEILAP
jgi:hypothetical protein